MENVRRHIRFNTVTIYIDHDDERFSVRVTDLKTRLNSIESFDYVAVAVGHFSVPNIPHFEGIETFPGRVVQYGAMKSGVYTRSSRGSPQGEPI